MKRVMLRTPGRLGAGPRRPASASARVVGDHPAEVEHDRRGRRSTARCARSARRAAPRARARRRAPRISCMICALTIGASPSEGSSSSSTRGCAISARPIESIWRSPPDSEPASCVRRSRSGGNSSYISLQLAARRRRATARRGAGSPRSRARRSRRAPRARARARAGRCPRPGTPRISSPYEQHAPAARRLEARRSCAAARSCRRRWRRAPP